MNTSYVDADLFIIDLGLGDGSGYDIIKWIRGNKESSAPIIITSGYADADKKVYGFDIGADDYMTKPFIPEELLARIKAQLRRNNNQIHADNKLVYKNITFNTENHDIMIGKRKGIFSKKETHIIQLFLGNIGVLITKSKLIENVWNENDMLEVSDNTVNVTLYSIRKKLGKKFKLETKIGEGYVLLPE
ncbi:MAG: response regulator transcription factor [Candidatus Gracilibacteria bacterium]|nr:response regulator transcription factor [Candidatus Gracilibacteria bacterium]